MSYPNLWIYFHHQDEQIDRWALYLETEAADDCEIWQASGQTFEYEPAHIRGMRAEAVPNFKEKWLMRKSLMRSEIKVVREIADNHPVDNEGAYWDCRIFCFEILALLESRGVLDRKNQRYCNVRKMLHEKWKRDDGVSDIDSEDFDNEDEVSDEEHDTTQVDDSNLEGQPQIDKEEYGKEGPNAGNPAIGRKRALSHSSNDRGRPEDERKATCASIDSNGTKRQKE